MGSKYASVSVTGYNAAPPADDGTQVSTNQIKWATIKDKLSDPLNTFASALDTVLVEAFDTSARSVTSTSSTLSSDNGKTIEIASTVTTSININLGDAASMAAGYIVGVVNRSGIAQTIGRVTSADTINGVASNKSIPSLAAIRLMVNSQANGYTIIGQAQDSFPSSSSSGLTIGTPAATTSGTTVDFTSLPAGIKQIILSWDEVTHNGTSAHMVQIGDSGGVETTGYLSQAGSINSTPAAAYLSSSAGFLATTGGLASEAVRGQMILTLIDAANNEWSMQSCLGTTTGATTYSHYSSGTKALSATLDRVRFTSVTPNTFNAGRVNIAYQ
jgi:hypothetical protein